MIVIGEKLNSSIPSSRILMQNGDEEGIRALAQAQKTAGAAFIDINAGAFLDGEEEKLAFLAATVSPLGFPLSIDTPSPAAAARALKAAPARGHIINSVTAEPGRLSAMTELAAQYGCGVVALCMSATGEPETQDSRLNAAHSIIGYLTGHGIREEEIYIDPMLHPLAAEEGSGLDALEIIRRLRALFPACHISIGLSNLSYGLPARRLVNRSFAVMAMAAGLDAAIADPLDRELMGLLSASDAILGRDEYCLEYIGRCRAGEIG